MLYREEEREMNPFCADQGVGLLPWSPLARGRLTGNRDRGGRANTVRAGNDAYGETLYDEADFDVVDVVREVAEEKGVPMAQVALAWLLGRPGVTAPIVGATKVAHIDDAIAAAGLTLDDKEAERLEAPYRPHPVRGHG
ncbi:aldo/keto reductase [Actinomadura physcomitrii]|nr:aldo/keto reductase [Actinomadura physcomitrii]